MRLKDKVGFDVKQTIMGAALVGQAIWEALEHVEDGDNALTAAGKALDTHRMRKKAIARANKYVARESRKR